MFNTTLTQEYQQAAQTFGLDRAAIQQLVYNALHAAFLPPLEKARLRAEFDADFDRLSQPDSTQERV